MSRKFIRTVHGETGRTICFHFDIPRLRNVLSRSVLDVLERMVENGGSAELAGLKSFPSFVSAISRILGKGSCDVFGEESLKTVGTFKLDHLFSQYNAPTDIVFQLIHKDHLSANLCSKDLVHYVKLAGPPYFVGDYNKKKPVGLMELAATVQMQDLIWIDESFLFAGACYWWENQYLCDITTHADQRAKTRTALDRVLYHAPLPQNPARNYASMIRYRDDPKGEIEMAAIGKVLQPGDAVKVLGNGKSKHLVRPGMGVIFEANLSQLAKFHNYVQALDPEAVYQTREMISNHAMIYGTVIGFDTCPVAEEVGILVRVHLCDESTPSWLLSKMKGSYLIQTNLEATISSRFLIAYVQHLACCIVSRHMC